MPSVAELSIGVASLSICKDTGLFVSTSTTLVEGTFSRPLAYSDQAPHSAAEPNLCQVQEELTRDVHELQGLDGHVDALYAEINQAQARIEALDRVRKDLRKRISLGRGRISPLRSFPVELLQEIFKHCLPNARYICPSPRQAPLLLGQICRRWRAIAHATSELWTSIALVDFGTWTSEPYLTMVDRWLSNAGSRPLWISIASAVRMLRGSPPSELVQLINSHSADFYEVSVQGSNDYIQSVVGEARPLSSLHSIDLTFHTDSGTFLSNLDIAPTAFNLQCAAISGVDHAAITSQSVLAGITELTYTLYTTPGFIRVLNDCKNLCHLEIRLQNIAEESDAPETYVGDHQILDRIQSVHIDMDDDFRNPSSNLELTRLLDKLTFPSLRKLTISAPGERVLSLASWVPLYPVVALVGRSSYPHKQLGFQNFHDEGSGGMLKFIHNMIPNVLLFTD